jgi:hypothetical protein
MTTSLNNLEDNDDYEEDGDIDEDDYVFVLSPEGELKSLMFPEYFMEDPPKEVQKILKILGIKNIHLMEPRTIH